ncbi:MAG: leucine--tRNA ligase [Bacilli bacterium]
MEFTKIEKKWQNIWQQGKYFEASNNSKKEKYYLLVEFPYPSGSGLHVGHVRSYSALDAMARLKRLQGFNVLFPMGWDAFGAPAEQYAIKNHIYPADAVKENIITFKGQIESLGLSFDWSREFSTTDPEYYKWTQWQFLLFYKHNMAYKAEKEINWCPVCKSGLSNEDSSGGVCERCGSPVTKKNKSQWILKMSDYSEKLLKGLDDTDFEEKIKTAQVNWIGKSIGAEVEFNLKDTEDSLKVFTTRCDTLFGVTFMVLSPEHSYLEKYKDKIKNYDEVITYQAVAKEKSTIERTDATKEKTGVKLDGLVAINPVSNETIEIWISDYVLASYGTGAIMAVPAHDERDYAFAKKFNIPIREVIKGGDIKTASYAGNGEMVNSGFLNGIKDSATAINKMLEYLTQNNLGKKTVNYRLQDWIFSRQRFWGEPIPMIHCSDCGWVPVEEKDLPVLLPTVAKYEPTENGESPLANIDEWVNTPCPKCGKMAKRETDTMPNWAGSSWYWLRFMDPHNDKEFVGMDAMKYWGMVDYYNGGMEHATRHLLYARFWHQFLYDLGLVPTPEPFKKRVAHGMILGSNNEKMSKSKGNVINPDDMVKEYGADALRCYELFVGDYEKDAAWSDFGLKGCKRFLDKVERLFNKVVEGDNYSIDLEKIINKTIKKVTNDLLTMNYNTAVSALMILTNAFEEQKTITKKDYQTLLILLNPISPHLTEELNEQLGYKIKIVEMTFPVCDESKIIDTSITIGVQVNGKLRASINVTDDLTEEEIKSLALKEENVIKHINNQEILKTIIIPKKIVNIVVKNS